MIRHWLSLAKWQDQYQRINKYQRKQAKLLQSALLDPAELQSLYQCAHAASLIPPQCLLEQQQLGDIASRYRGAGLDYEESRLYQAGDEPRFINWRLTARSGKTQVKQFREERRPAVFILLDQGNTMRFGTQTRLKVTQATRLAALIAFAAIQQNWAVSAVRLNEYDPQQSHQQTIDWFPASHDADTIWQWVQQWAAACPPVQHKPTRDADIVKHQSSDLINILPLLQAQLLQGTHVYLLSDFIDLSPACQPALLQLQQQHPLFTVHIIDPIELELPNLGQMVLQDHHTSAQQNVDLSNPDLRKQFKHNAQQRQATIKQQLQGLGCHYYPLLTPEPHPEISIPLPHGMGL